MKDLIHSNKIFTSDKLLSFWFLVYSFNKLEKISFINYLQAKIDNKKFIQLMTLSLADNPRYKKNKHIL